MAYNAVAFKQSMLAWAAAAKKAPADLVQAAKTLGGDDPKAAKIGAQWSAQITDLNAKLGDLLDRVVTAKDDKSRTEAAKKALGNVKQYQAFLTAAPQFPPAILTSLKNGLAQLTKNLS